MNCLIVEDQPPAQRLLQGYVAQTEGLHLLGTYADPTEALKVLRKGRVDLLLLDVHLPKIDGFDLLRLLRRPPSVILTTAYNRYAVESYDLGVADYLLKPIAYARFLAAVDKVRGNQPPGLSVRELFVKSGHAYVRIDASAVLFVRSDRDYTELHEADRKHLSSRTLVYWEEALGAAEFMRVHKTYLVSRSHIDKLRSDRLVLSDGREIPIGRKYRAVVRQRLLGE